MRSPYTVLGVSKSAKAGEIKSAYRQLAKTWHPDQNRTDPHANGRFAEIAHAYKMLIDTDLREQFDGGHIDAGGRRRTKSPRGFTKNPFTAFRQAWRATENANASARTDDTSVRQDEASFEDMVVHIFGEAAAKRSDQDAATAEQPATRRSDANAPGLDEDPLAALDALFEKWKTRQKPRPQLPETHHHVEISLEEAFAGYRGEIDFGGEKTVTFVAPPGTLDRTEVRVASPDPSAYADVIVTLRHKQHPRLRSSGADLHGDHAIELAEAVLGGSFVFQTLDGPVKITVPGWSGSDTVLSVGDKGLPTGKGDRGALHVHLRLILPEKPDTHLINLMRSSRKALFV